MCTAQYTKLQIQNLDEIVSFSFQTEVFTSTFNRTFKRCFVLNDQHIKYHCAQNGSGKRTDGFSAETIVQAVLAGNRSVSARAA